ncbi:MAG: bifunctional riboflavin kinase/FAD synthetase [Candidatus Accumulibacter sp.]|jgi:riboflavin kinase/FMN adenylyltransferase|nr:bifunctional riboflavin kinase/FAD synthetase [Accumulibacter sp.]
MFVHRGFPSDISGQVALTIGNFDGVHLGHRALLARLVAAAKARGQSSAVLTFEPHPREFFAKDASPARISTLREKLERIAAEGVERVFVCRFDRRFAAISAEDFIDRVLVERLKTAHLIVGDDFCFGASRRGNFALLQKAGDMKGFQVEAMPGVMMGGDRRVSSSAIRSLLGEGRLDCAARLLGRPFSIDGRVVHGMKRGRDLGFATTNIRLRGGKSPLFGVFAVEVGGVGDRVFRGVANLGFRPSVDSDPRPLLETHVFDFSGDLYGCRLKVCFLCKIRDEIRFAELENLKARIAEDVASAKRFFKHSI